MPGQTKNIHERCKLGLGTSDLERVISSDSKQNEGRTRYSVKLWTLGNIFTVGKRRNVPKTEIDAGKQTPLPQQYHQRYANGKTFKERSRISMFPHQSFLVYLGPKNPFL